MKKTILLTIVMTAILAHALTIGAFAAQASNYNITIYSYTI